MPFLDDVIIGGIVFSMLCSFVSFLRSARTEKSGYERWLDEIRPQNIVKSRSTF